MRRYSTSRLLPAPVCSSLQVVFVFKLLFKNNHLRQQRPPLSSTLHTGFSSFRSQLLGHVVVSVGIFLSTLWKAIISHCKIFIKNQYAQPGEEARSCSLYVMRRTISISALDFWKHFSKYGRNCIIFWPFFRKTS